MPTSLAANCTFKISTYTILVHHVSQLKSPLSLFCLLNPAKKIYIYFFVCHFILGTKIHANYNSDLRNAACYVTGSREFALAVHNGFSKRYRKVSYFCQYIKMC